MLNDKIYVCDVIFVREHGQVTVQAGGAGAESTPPVTELRVTPAILSNEISVVSRCLSPRSSFIERDEGPRTRVPADMSYCKQEGNLNVLQCHVSVHFGVR